MRVNGRQAEFDRQTRPLAQAKGWSSAIFSGAAIDTPAVVDADTLLNGTGTPNPVGNPANPASATCAA